MVFFSDRNGFSTNDMYAAICKDVNMHLISTTCEIKRLDDTTLQLILPGLSKTMYDLENLIYSVPLEDNELQHYLNNMLLELKLRHQFIVGRIEYIISARSMFSDSFEHTPLGPSVNGIVLGM